jgi:uncharacterized protein involved in outer membrane biogenesis
MQDVSTCIAPHYTFTGPAALSFSRQPAIIDRVRTRFVALSAVVLIGCLALVLVIVLRQSSIAGLVRASAETRLSAALGQPITIGKIGLTFSPRPAFTGSGIRVGPTEAQAPGLRIARIRVVPRLRSFFSDTVQIEEVQLDGFTVSILRDKDGWHAPAVLPTASQGAGTGVSIERVRVAGGRLMVFDASGGAVRETSSIEEVGADMLMDAGRLRLAPLTGRIGTSPVEGEATADASAVRLTFKAPSINDADLAAVLGLLGAARPAIVHLDQPAAASIAVTIDRTQSRLTGQGAIRVPALTVEPLRMQRVEAPFTIEGSRMTFSPTTFVLNGGAHRGRMTLALDADPARWSADSQLEGADIGALLDALAGRDARIDGRGAVKGTLHGRVEKDFISGVDGRLRLDVADGVLHDFPLLAAINRTLRLAGTAGSDTQFERLSATLAIAQGVAATDDLVIDARDLRVTGAGRIGFDGALNVRGLVAISAERVSAAVASVRELARAKNSRGEIELPLVISGTLGSPTFAIDLETAILHGARDELMRRLKGLFRRLPDVP